MFVHKLTDDAELRLFEPRHAEELFSLINRNRIRLSMMPFVEYATSVDAERERSLHQFAEGRGFECGLWYCGELHGAVGMFPIDLQNRSTEFGYWVDEEAEGKGLVTRACSAIIRYLFDAMNLNRIVIRTVPANMRSKAVATRLGFTYEGTLRRSERLQGELVDVEIFSLLRQDASTQIIETQSSAFFTSSIDNNSALALLEPHHSREVYVLIDRNREYLRRWLRWVDDTKSEDETLANRKECLHQFAENGTIVAGIRYNGALAGTIWLHSIGATCMDIGYWLSEDCQGKGLVTMACRKLIEHAFNNLGVIRIEIRVQPENHRSRAIPERLGFTHEGTLRQKGADAEGRRHDLMMFSLLKDEWGESGSHGH